MPPSAKQFADGGIVLTFQKKICRVGKISDAAYFQTLAHLCKGSSLLALTFKHNFFSLWDGTATKSCAAHLANHTR